MERIAGGDQHAFIPLYQQLAGLVNDIVLRVVRDWSSAEEITQETLLEVWRLAPRYDRTKGSVEGWTTAIAKRRAVDHVRSQQATRRRDDRHAHLQGSQVDSVAVEFEHRMDRERVASALDELTAVQRQAVALAYYAGHTYRQVAVLLDLPEGTVKSRIRGGLTRLRRTLTVTP